MNVLYLRINALFVQMSLYEDMVAAWVPAKHEWLRKRPLGEELVERLGKQKMFSYCACMLSLMTIFSVSVSASFLISICSKIDCFICFTDDLLFLHFGTSNEVLDHLSGVGSELVGRRHLCSIPATTASDITASAIILSSKIEPGVSVGEDSLIYDSSISGGIHIGSLCIVVGVNIFIDDYICAEDSIKFMLPDRHCLWEVPLVGSSERVLVYCGLHDNPKSLLSRDGTFCGKPWKKVLHDLGIQETDLWGSSGTDEKCLWNSKIFPILPYAQMLKVAMWLMGLVKQKTDYMLSLWKSSRRISLEELHRSIDFSKMCVGSSNHQADLAAGIAKACISYGMLGRNLSQLCEEVLQKEDSGVEICKDFLAMCPKVQEQNANILPKSRAYQVQVDLLRACNDERTACELEHKVWAAVADETASAVRYGFKGAFFDHHAPRCHIHGSNFANNSVQPAFFYFIY